jgi:glycerol-3-phosphate acyltransferase PlsY
MVTLAACPLRYRWSEIERLPRRPSVAARRGVELHRHIELHNRGSVPFEEAETGFYDAVGEEAAPASAYAKFTRSRFAAIRPILVESPFTLVVGEARISGRIDAVYEDAAGWEVVDFKSGRASDDPARRVQLEAYALAVAEAGLAGGRSPGSIRVTFAYCGGEELEEVTESVDAAWLAAARAPRLAACRRRGPGAPADPVALVPALRLPPHVPSGHRLDAGPPMMWALALGYLIGSVPTADLLGRRRGIDLRNSGTGNPGAANALGVGGRGLAAAVLGFDLGKGALAALVGEALGGDGTAVAAAVAAIAAQVHNPWFGFRGGKGLGVTGGTLAVLWLPGLLVTLPVLGAVSPALGSALGSLVGLATMGGAAVVWARRDWAMAWGIAADDLLVWYAIGVIVLTAPKFLAGLSRRTPTGVSAGR